MTDYVWTVTAEAWQLVADSTDPYQHGVDPNPHRWLLDGATASWAIDTLPPIATPATVQVQVYDDGQHPDGWLDVEQGQAVRATLRVHGNSLRRVMILDGRVTDLSAVNHPRGGVVFNLVLTDALGADLAGDTAPSTIAKAGGDGGVTTSMCKEAYDYLIEEIPLQVQIEEDETGDIILSTALDYTTDLAPIADARSREYDATNQSVLDVLNLYVAHDIRTRLGPFPIEFHTVTHYLQQTVVDAGSDAPEPIRYRVIEYDWLSPFNMDEVLVMHWTGSVWTAIYDENYYDTFFGMVLDSSQVLVDVGEWRQLRNQAVNRIELQGDFERDAGANVKTVRSSWGDLIRAYGTNSRSMSSPCWYRDEGIAGYGALEVATAIRGEKSQVQQGFGFTTATIVWDQLTDQQEFAWAEHMWPVDGVQAYARPMAIVNIPDDWRLTSGPLVFGRLMGVTFQLDRGELFAQLTMRSVPVSTILGITWDELGALVPTVTWNNLDPALTWDQLSVTRAT